MFSSRSETSVKPTAAPTDGSCEIPAGPGEGNPGLHNVRRILCDLTAEARVLVLPAGIFVPANSVSVLIASDSSGMAAITCRHPTCAEGGTRLSPG